MSSSLYCSSEPAADYPECTSEAGRSAAQRHHGREQPAEATAAGEGETEAEAAGASQTETAGKGMTHPKHGHHGNQHLRLHHDRPVPYPRPLLRPAPSHPTACGQFNE